MSGLSCPWISGAYASSVGRSRSLSKFPSRIHHLSPKEIDGGGGGVSGNGFAVFSCCKSQAELHKDLKFVLHDALDDSGIDTTHARVCISFLITANYDSYTARLLLLLLSSLLVK